MLWIEGSFVMYSSIDNVEPRNVPNCTNVSWHCRKTTQSIRRLKIKLLPTLLMQCLPSTSAKCARVFWKWMQSSQQWDLGRHFIPHSTHWHIPDFGNFHSHCYKNFKCHSVQISFSMLYCINILNKSLHLLHIASRVSIGTRLWARQPRNPGSILSQDN
jgi:hypothetical protein